MNTSENKAFYLDLPQEVVKGLQENRMDLKEYILQRLNDKLEGDFEFDVKDQYLETKDGSQTSRSKDLMSVIEASAKILPPVIACITALIKMFSDKKYLTVLYKYDEAGNLIEKKEMTNMNPKDSGNLYYELNLFGKNLLKFEKRVD